MNRIEKCSSNPGALENAAWGLFGLGGGALISCLALYASADYSHGTDGNATPNWKAIILTGVILIVAICGIATGCICRYHAKDKRRMQASIVGEVIDEMKGHEDRCLKMATAGGPHATQS